MVEATQPWPGPPGPTPPKPKCTSVRTFSFTEVTPDKELSSSAGPYRATWQEKYAELERANKSLEARIEQLEKIVEERKSGPEKKRKPQLSWNHAGFWGGVLAIIAVIFALMLGDR